MEAFPMIVLFYLVLLLKWELVLRPILYWIGMLAIVATMFFGFFSLGVANRWICDSFRILGTVAALACAVGAVYRGKLPDAVQRAIDQATQPPKK